MLMPSSTSTGSMTIEQLMAAAPPQLGRACLVWTMKPVSSPLGVVMTVLELFWLTA